MNIEVSASPPVPEGVPIRFDEVVPLKRFIDGKWVEIGTARIDGHVEDLLHFTCTVTDKELIKEISPKGSYSIGFRPGNVTLHEDPAYRPFEVAYLPPPNLRENADGVWQEDRRRDGDGS